MLIGYARVSTPDQKINLQLDALKKYGIDERNIFREQMTGAIEKRPVLDNMLEYLKDGDILVVYKLDRLGRSLPNLLKIMENLKKKNVKFKSITENIDTETVSGNLIFHVMALLSDFERSLLVERTKAGIEAAKARGVKCGGRKEVLNDEQKKQVIEFREQGKPLSYIARMMGVSRTPIRKLIEIKD